MNARMAARAKPLDIERLRIVAMVSMNTAALSAALARLANQLAIADGVPDCRLRLVALRVPDAPSRRVGGNSLLPPTRLPPVLNANVIAHEAVNFRI